MTSDTALADKIRRFVHQTFPASRKAGLRDDQSLLDNGVVDSLGILEIVTFLETEIGLALRDDDIQIENFQSVEAMTRLARERLDETGKS